jgi:hypothetical protein
MIRKSALHDNASFTRKLVLLSFAYIPTISIVKKSAEIKSTINLVEFPDL